MSNDQRGTSPTHRLSHIGTNHTMRKHPSDLLPLFTPSVEVAASWEYEITVFQDHGLVNDQEYTELAERVPGHIKRTLVPIQWQGPGVNSNMHVGGCQNSGSFMGP